MNTSADFLKTKGVIQKDALPTIIKIDGKEINLNQLLNEFAILRLNGTLDYIIENCSSKCGIEKEDGLKYVDTVVSTQSIESFKNPLYV